MWKQTFLESKKVSVQYPVIVCMIQFSNARCSNILELEWGENYIWEIVRLFSTWWISAKWTGGIYSICTLEVFFFFDWASLYLLIVYAYPNNIVFVPPLRWSPGNWGQTYASELTAWYLRILAQATQKFLFQETLRQQNSTTQIFVDANTKDKEKKNHL